MLDIAIEIVVELSDAHIGDAKRAYLVRGVQVGLHVDTGVEISGDKIGVAI